jgi:serine/threonine protein kinase
MSQIVQDDMPPLPEDVSSLLEDFLKLCFQKDLALRPTAKLLYEHQWLKKSRRTPNV